MKTVVLSRRNLLTLLAKLEQGNSTCSLLKPCGTLVVAQPDEVVYAGREPGDVHPDTLVLMAKIDKALRND